MTINFFKRSTSEVVFVDNGIDIPFVIFEEPVDNKIDLVMQPCEYFNPVTQVFQGAKISISKDIVLYVEDEFPKISVQGTHFSHIELVDVDTTVITSMLPVEVINSYNELVGKYRDGLLQNEVHVLDAVGAFINQYCM
jgi:hypothetical protein